MLRGRWPGRVSIFWPRRLLGARAAVTEGEGVLPCTEALPGVALLSDMQQHECAMSWKAHCGEVYSVEFSCDENAVYSIGDDGKVGTGRGGGGGGWTVRGLWGCGLLSASILSSVK